MQSKARMKEEQTDAGIVGARATVGLMALICTMSLGAFAGKSLWSTMAYQRLEPSIASLAERSAGGKKGETDDEGNGKGRERRLDLRGINPDYTAWLRVSGTPISYPVVQPEPPRNESWYLSHDFWNNPSELGCPFLDERACAGGTHLIVYGHHIFGSDAIFSPLVRAYEQETFDGIGPAYWETDDGPTVFEPLFSLRVDRSYATIQRFGLRGDELRSWLRLLQKDASALSPACNERITRTNRVLTLSTCSSTVPGGRWRTLVVFSGYSDP